MQDFEKTPEDILSAGDRNVDAVDTNQKYRDLLGKAVVGLAGASLVFEQTPLNEALRTNIGLDVLSSTQSPTAVGLTVAAVTIGIEGVSSGLITAGLNLESETINKLKKKITKIDGDSLNADQDQKDTKKKDKSLLGKVAEQGSDVGVALGLGAGLVTIKKHMADPEPTLGKDISASIKATAIVSGVSGMIGYIAAGGLNQTEGTFLEKPVDYFVDYATDTRFWIGALAVGYSISFIRKGIKSLRRNNNNEENIARFLESTHS